MDYDTLLEKYRTKETFIYGRSVMQIVDKNTYEDSGVTKTDFIYQTERQNRGVITVAHEEAADGTSP
ncbi:MAG: hypothetical protein V6Z89_08335 [Desulfobacter sp.]